MQVLEFSFLCFSITVVMEEGSVRKYDNYAAYKRLKVYLNTMLIKRKNLGAD